MGLLEDLASVFGDIPRHVWEPIARQESGLNPFAHNTKGEDSRGLFQINVQANPAFAGLNLFDPVVNAKIARDYFIGPAWRKVADHPDPGYQAAYVWQHGIKPDWGQVQARGADKELMAQARTIAGVTTSTGESPTGPPQEDNILKPGFWTGAGLFILLALALILLFVTGGFGLAKAFGADPVKLVKGG